jgi:hypothetical protein
MKNQLEAALNGEPWAVSGVVFGLDDVLDDEGRPLRERRAPSSAKKGVPIELRPCPYHDERQGLPMNVSALEQLLRHFSAVAKSVAAFRGMLGEEARPWEGMLDALLDLLAAPGIHLLRARDPRGRVPAIDAAGYKLAAGYFDALRRLLLLEAKGRRQEVSAAGFLEFVREHRALIGAGEACAGPPQLIARLTRSFLDAAPPVTAIDRRRVAIASTLAAQVRLGIAWELLDEAAEERLLGALRFAGALRPRTPVVARRLADRIEALAAVEAADAEGIYLALPGAPSAESNGLLRCAIRAWAAGAAADEGTVKTVDALLAPGDGGLEVVGDAARAICARSFSNFLVLYRGVVGAQWRLECDLRAQLGFPIDVEMKLHSTILPVSMFASWLETITGHRLLCTPAPSPEIVLHNHHRTVVAIAAGA